MNRIEDFLELHRRKTVHKEGDIGREKDTV